jgi:hypothetical protein
VKRQLFTSSDRLAFTLSIPAKVRPGSQEQSGALQQAVDPNVAAFGGPRLNLRPTATERDLELRLHQLLRPRRQQGPADRRADVPHQPRP